MHPHHLDITTRIPFLYFSLFPLKTGAAWRFVGSCLVKKSRRFFVAGGYGQYTSLKDSN